MKITFKKLIKIKEEHLNKKLKLIFSIEKDLETGICGHNFSLELKCIPLSVSEVEIEIVELERTYFPKAWSKWSPLITLGDSLIHSYFQGFTVFNVENRVTVSFRLSSEIRSCNLYSYKEYDYVDVLRQLDSLKLKAEEVLNLGNNGPYIFRFGRNPKTLIVARQHPGEGIASSFVQGIEEYLETNEGTNSRGFLLVPAMGIKGIAEGRYRTSNTVDMNRSWDRNVPEILEVKNIIDRYKISTVVDVHGDELSKIIYSRKLCNSNFILPKEVLQLDQPSRLRVIFSRLKHGVLTSPKGASLGTYCSSKNIGYTLLELPMCEVSMSELGKKIAYLNFM